MHEEESETGLGSGDVVFAIVMIVAAVLLGLVHWVGTGFACAWDTSTCASTSEKNGVYEGLLRTEGGELYRSSEFVVRFAALGEDSEVPFKTDEDGRYCIRWAFDSFDARTPAGEDLEEEPLSGVGTWRDLEGRDPPPGCQESDVGIPWDRAKDAESTWQYWLLIALPFAVIGALIWALADRRSRYAFQVYVAGGLLLLANLIALVLL